MVSDRLFDRACEELQAQTKKVFELTQMHNALLVRHNALVEAVAWERECCQDIRPLVAWADLYVRHGEDYVDSVADDLRAIQDAARAEVDRILMEPTP
jgi:hypothetical protein